MSDDSSDSKKGYNYPKEIRDAMIARKYAETSFRDQAVDDMCEMLSFAYKHHEEIIKNFKAQGGVIEKDRDQEGNILPRTYLFYIGSTLMHVEFDKDQHIINIGFECDFTIESERVRNLDLDIEMIMQTATAIIYRDNPQKAIDWLKEKAVDLWNESMVFGMEDKAKKILENEMAMPFFFAGANVQTLKAMQNYIASRPKPLTTEKKTEYGDI